jgi:hypothetical protein
MQNIKAKFHLSPTVKYVSHCTDFHEACNCCASNNLPHFIYLFFCVCNCEETCGHRKILLKFFPISQLPLDQNTLRPHRKLLVLETFLLIPVFFPHITFFHFFHSFCWFNLPFFSVTRWIASADCHRLLHPYQSLPNFLTPVTSYTGRMSVLDRGPKPHLYCSSSFICQGRTCYKFCAIGWHCEYPELGTSRCRLVTLLFPLTFRSYFSDRGLVSVAVLHCRTALLQKEL